MAYTGFRFSAYKYGDPAPWAHSMTAAAGTYKIGQALVVSGGKLVTVSSGVGEDTDEGSHYISQADITLAEDGPLPVVLSDSNIEWQVPLQAANTNLAVGLSYTIHTDGLQLTSTTTKGCCRVVGFDGKAAGDLATVILV